MNADDVVSAESLAYAYGDGTIALSDISLSIGRGEFVSVVGPSGCGKSTLLALLAGLLEPAVGTIEWSMSDQQQVPGSIRQRPFTLVFQRDTVLPWLTVERNVGLGLRYLDLTAEEKRERVTRLLSMGGLSDFANFLPSQLSGGMRRRVAMLTGVAPLPRVLLMDEPFVGLDEPTRIHIHDDLRQLIGELGISVLLVTHDLAEALTLSDRLYLLSARPGSIVSVIDVPFGPDRQLIRLRETQEYQDMYRSVWQVLATEIERARAA
jgi:ABC-type nitrate/sulfonate/bicarbonate transport system ATPase subunit